MNVLAVLQARVSSSRLPRKVLEPILRRPMLEWQIERIRRARNIDELVLATSNDGSDDDLEAVSRSAGVKLYRGSLDDVLDRVYRAAVERSPAHVVRLTGDCPLTDPAVIDLVIDAHLEGGGDYTSNALNPTFPDGLDVEVIRFPALEEAWRNAALRSEREHVTPYLYKHPERFRIRSVTSPVDRSAMRWTVDEPADFLFVRTVFEALAPSNPRFGTEDILQLLADRPELERINAGRQRNEGYARSLQQDAEQTARMGTSK